MIPLPRDENLKYWVGGDFISNRPLVPYSDLAIDFLNDLAAHLRASSEAKAYPDVMTFAFWCRKSSILKFKEQSSSENNRLGKGLAFHIAPANVPINFAFSFVFGLLAGNANLVRLPSRSFPQTEILCSAINAVLNQDKYLELKSMTAFVQYPSGSLLTEEFSKICQARLIWGGDDTIRQIRKFPIPERSAELVFSDRYSFCVLGCDTILSSSPEQLTQLAEAFYNDAYLMDQNACSSPHMVLWLGKAATSAQEKFWPEVAKVVSNKSPIPMIAAVDKYTHLCQDAIELDSCAKMSKIGSSVFRVELSELPADVTQLRGQHGYFYEYQVDQIEKIAKIVTEKYQTLTYYGVDVALLRDFVMKNRLHGIDRIVPVGKALEMNVIWDGTDVIKSLSRVIDVIN